MTGGYLHGGWSFVIAAYSASLLLLLAYGVSLYVRYRNERARHDSGSEGWR
jgi:hypothetical protein